MRRKKRKHVAIPNEGLRKATLGRRRDYLFKKAKELSTLCDVKVGVIIQDQEKNDDFVWPSHQEVEEKLTRFLSIPDIDRNRKMSTHESFLTERVSKIITDLWKIHEKNDEQEKEQLMHKLMKGKLTIKELDIMKTTGLIQLLLEKMNKFERRIRQLHMLDKLENQSLPTNPHFPSFVHQMLEARKASLARESGVAAVFPAPELVENYKNDQSISGYDSIGITPDKSLIDDFKNNEWCFDSQANANISNPNLIENLKNDKWLIETTFNKQNNFIPNCASDMGFYHTNAGCNVGNYNTEGSTIGGNHIDFTPTYEVTDPSGGKNDEFPDVEWPHIFLP